MSEQERELSTADLAAAAERQAAEQRMDLEVPIRDREVERHVVSTPADMRVGDNAALFASDLVNEFHTKWNEVQAGFVDEPRRAVEQADQLVADAIKHLAESFARERSKLEAQWDRGDDVNTEDLRQALQRYRSFFSRLLAV